MTDEDKTSLHKFVKPPEPTWEWRVGGWKDGPGTTWSAYQAPHWLGRVLQKWLLDIHWRKL